MRLFHVPFRRSAIPAMVLACAIMNPFLAIGNSAAATNQIGPLGALFMPGESEHAEVVQGPFLPAVTDTRIFDGKHASVIDLDALPRIVNDNYRQALTFTPGLLLSESGRPGLELGYRGLSPSRGRSLHLLKDGMSVQMEPFASPETDYSPPLEMIDRVEFIRGGSSLMYGPQPGGALNYVTHQPRTDTDFSARSGHVLGTDNPYSTYNSFEGTLGRIGYYANFHYRGGEGFRDANNDLTLYAGTARLVLDADKESRWLMNFDAYEEIHGEPGGLTAAGFAANPKASTRLLNTIEVKHYFLSLRHERDLGENTLLMATAWGGFNYRSPSRQTGGGFGTDPTGATRENVLEKFISEGLEARLRHDWDWLDERHTLAGGVMVYHTDSPRTDRFLPLSGAPSPIAYDADRTVLHGAVFLENRFVFDRFTITPGVRLENHWRKIEEEVNVNKPAPESHDQHDFIPLVGVGMTYEVCTHIEAYANVSQSYAPQNFTETLPTTTNFVVNSSLDSATAWQYEIGLRGQPKSWLTFDTSLFLIDFDDRIGPSGNTFENIGRSIHQGWEARVELDVVSWLDDVRETDHADAWGTVSLHGNVSLLHAEFVSGPHEGNEPAYAPDHLIRTGLVYRWRDRVKVALLGTFVDDHWANDNNGRFDTADADSSGFIPHYTVWDLSLEAKVYRDLVSVVAGINNLFDEDYYSRITADGINPSAGRNYYAGASVRF